MPQGRCTDRVTRIHVVVPAHDEAELLPGSLASLAAAMHHVRRRLPGVRAGLTVVLDACTDASARTCAEHGVDVVTITARNVGAARAAGTSRARALMVAEAGTAEHTWIAHTDADSRVPLDWLTDQIEVAAAGADVVLGRVEPDATATADVLARWHTLHPPGRVGAHGANLGVRLSAYDAVGGITHLREHEDLDLVTRLLADGARPGAARRPVTTSSRLEGRTGGGFAGYLADLADLARARGPGLHEATDQSTPTPAGPLPTESGVGPVTPSACHRSGPNNLVLDVLRRHPAPEQRGPDGLHEGQRTTQVVDRRLGQGHLVQVEGAGVHAVDRQAALGAVLEPDVDRGTRQRLHVGEDLVPQGEGPLLGVGVQQPDGQRGPGRDQVGQHARHRADARARAEEDERSTGVVRTTLPNGSDMVMVSPTSTKSCNSVDTSPSGTSEPCTRLTEN